MSSCVGHLYVPLSVVAAIDAHPEWLERMRKTETPEQVKAVILEFAKVHGIKIDIVEA